jgi:hypothetical protein
MRLTVEECVRILESYSKIMSYANCRQSFLEKFRILKINIARDIEEVNEKNAKKSCEEHGETCR